jgi:hypothetical protein
MEQMGGVHKKFVGHVSLMYRELLKALKAEMSTQAAAQQAATEQLLAAALGAQKQQVGSCGGVADGGGAPAVALPCLCLARSCAHGQHCLLSRRSPDLPALLCLSCPPTCLCCACLPSD